MNEYKQPFQEAEAEFTEKRSRFIGHVWTVSTEEEALQHIKEVKSKHYDARHNCWCYLVGDTIRRYSDDGEPQGTAGQPMLKVFEHLGVTNACCVVTRYFGGILLGTGGLTRAYSKSAKDALELAGVSTVREWRKLELICLYPLFERFKNEIAAVDGVIDDIVYSNDVSITTSIPEQNTQLLIDRLTELCSGIPDYMEVDTEFKPGPREDV